MKELVVISGKGGTGKTSISAALAVLAKPVVIADCDVDAADLHLLLQPEIKQTEEFFGGKVARIDSDKCQSCNRCREVCRFDAISTEYVVNPISCEGCGVCHWNCPHSAISFTERKDGDLFISDTRVGPMVHAELGIAEENSGKLVTRVRNQARELAEEQNLPFLMVDGPPGTGCPVIASISGADKLLIITEPTVSAIHDLLRVVQLAVHFEMTAIVCINKYDLNLEQTEKIESLCREKNIAIVGKIPYHAQMTRAQVAGRTIVEGEPSELKESIIQLWQNIRSIL